MLFVLLVILKQVLNDLLVPQLDVERAGQELLQLARLFGQAFMHFMKFCKLILVPYKRLGQVQ